MDNQKIGDLIKKLRKEKNLTQKGLADILMVTDKAVSKWERGLGYPEITIIPELANALGITISELLNGSIMVAEETLLDIENDVANINNDVILHTDSLTKHSLKNGVFRETELGFSNPDSIQATQSYVGSAMGADTKSNDIVFDIIEYSEEVKKHKITKVKSIIFLAINSTFLLALFTCMLCNYAISRKLDWSFYVLGSEVTAWIIITPFFTLRKHRLAASLSGLSISILPFLMLIEYLCPVKGWVLPMALPITGMSLICLWAAVFLLNYTKINKIYVLSFLFILFGVVLSLWINSFLMNYLKTSNNNITNYIVAVSCGFISVLLFLIKFVRDRLYNSVKIYN